jgi:hypothetical protein
MKRFGEIAIGDLFFYAKKKMKKLDAYNAVTVVERGKENFMFFKHNLVEEFVDHVINNEKKINSFASELWSSFTEYCKEKPVGNIVDTDYIDFLNECSEGIILNGEVAKNKQSKFVESSMILNGEIDSYIPLQIMCPYIPLEISSCEKDILQLQSTSRGIRNSKALQDELDSSFL